MNLKETIKKGISQGLKLIPTDNNKRPVVRSWKNGVSVSDINNTNNIKGIAVATGNGLECIDFDLKYDLTGDLYERYSSEVKSYSKELYESMVIQTTVNNGYHWFYNCDDLSDGNSKLARREANEEEKSKGEKVKVLLETRGIGGYVMIQPTKGYKMIQGKISNVSKISKLDRDFLMSLARSYNEYRDERKEVIVENITTTTAFDDYDVKVSSEDTITLLKNHGWSEVRRSGDRVMMLRAGSSSAKHSAYYELDKDRFSVFSTSTEFEPETRYKKSAVYTVLEHGGDFKKSASKLYSLGYGVSEELIVELDKKNEVDVDELDKYVVPYSNIWSVVDDWYDGNIETGLVTGMPQVDEFFVFRRKSLYTITANTNIGKTTVTQFFQVLGSKKHGLKWLIYAAENSEDDYAESLLSFYLGDNPKDVKSRNKILHDKGREFIEEHFFFLKDVRSVEKSLKVAKAFCSKYDIYALFIDPINSVAPRDNQDNWDYSEAITASRKIVDFRREYCSVWISQHPRIGKQREKGMPSTTDGEFGVFANKADVSIVFNRDKGLVDNNKTEMKIDKVRSKRLGCNITPDDHYIELEYHKYWFNFSAPLFYSNGTVGREYYKNPINPTKDGSNYIPNQIKPIENVADAFDDIVKAPVDFPDINEDEVPF